MPCARPSKSSTERPARSGSRAPVPRHAVCTSLSLSGRYEIADRDSDGRLRIETVGRHARGSEAPTSAARTEVTGESIDSSRIGNDHRKARTDDPEEQRGGNRGDDLSLKREKTVRNHERGEQRDVRRSA
jgi:hypothetical protein